MKSYKAYTRWDLKCLSDNQKDILYKGCFCNIAQKFQLHLIINLLLVFMRDVLND